MNRIARCMAATFGILIVAGTTACGSDHSTTTPAARTVRSGIPDSAKKFEVASPDLQDGQAMPQAQWANSNGCTGGNQAPKVQWSGAPAEAKSFAVTMFDVDAPTGSGLWHWLTWDIPATATDLTAAPNAVAGTNDLGMTGYLGPCPPTGDGLHHYWITVLALDTPTLGLPATTPPALAAFALYHRIVGYARMTVTAQQ
ncbi:YbhB/YbcL family Raf kinase inhibitor-like protein [Nocardia heshunensis]